MENNFRRLDEKGNAMFVTSPKKFQEDGRIDKYAVQSLKWAYDNAYNGHFKNASSSKFKTMLDAYLGKLGEFAVYEFFRKKGYTLELPETILRQKGEWDNGDLEVQGQKIQIKTTVFSSNFLLMRKKDWDQEGNYNWGHNGKDSNYGAFFLCRIQPDPKKIFLNECSLNELKNICENVSWRYEITGFVTKRDVVRAITDNYIIGRGKMLNGKVKINEDLIYFQSGDLKDPDLIPQKKITNEQ